MHSVALGPHLATGGSAEKMDTGIALSEVGRLEGMRAMTYVQFRPWEGEQARGQAV
jgi:hypothetical protein